MQSAMVTTVSGGHRHINQRYAAPEQILQRAIEIEHEAETFASVGLNRIAGDMKASARDLRALAKEASANAGRMGE